MPKHWEWDCDDGVIAARLETSRPRLIMDDNFLGSLIDGNHLGAEADALSQLRQERVRKMVRAASDLTHIRVIVAAIFTEQLKEGGVHHCFLIVEKTEHLDHAFRPSFEFKELPHGILIIFGIDLFPACFTLLLNLLDQWF